MARPIDLSRRFEYVLERERQLPAEQRTTWYFKHLSSVAKLRLVGRAPKVDEAGDVSASTEQVLAWGLDYLRHRLAGWSNYPAGATSGQVVFTTDHSGLPTEETLGMIESADLNEL